MICSHCQQVWQIKLQNYNVYSFKRRRLVIRFQDLHRSAIDEYMMTLPNGSWGSQRQAETSQQGMDNVTLYLDPHVLNNRHP